MTLKKTLIISIPLILLATLAVIAILYFLQTKKTVQKFVPKTNPNHIESAPLSLQAIQLKRDLTKTDKKVGDLILEKTPEYQIDYLISNDQFQITISALPYQDIKQKAEKFFLNKGFSQADLCGLRIGFYPTKAIADGYKPQPGDRLPGGCSLLISTPSSQ